MITLTYFDDLSATLTNAGLYNYLKLYFAKNCWLSDVNLIVVYADFSSAATESRTEITEELLAMFFYRNKKGRDCKSRSANPDQQ